MFEKGSDDVMMCTMLSNRGNVLRYFNDGRLSSQQTDSSLGLSNIIVTNDNGVLRCQFNRTNFISTSDNKFYNLIDSNGWYVLLAKGVLAGSKNKYIKFNFLIPKF